MKALFCIKRRLVHRRLDWNVYAINGLTLTPRAPSATRALQPPSPPLSPALAEGTALYLLWSLTSLLAGCTGTRRKESQDLHICGGTAHTLGLKGTFPNFTHGEHPRTPRARPALLPKTQRGRPRGSGRDCNCVSPVLQTLPSSSVYVQSRHPWELRTFLPGKDRNTVMFSPFISPHTSNHCHSEHTKDTLHWYKLGMFFKLL